MYLHKLRAPIHEYVNGGFRLCKYHCIQIAFKILKILYNVRQNAIIYDSRYLRKKQILLRGEKDVKEKIVCLLFCICLCVLTVHSISQASEKTEQVVVVGYFEDNDGLQEGFSDEERKNGYGYEYFQELAKYAGWRYEYVYGTWNDIYAKMISGEIDIMGAVTKTPRREREMLFPDERMGVEEYYLFTLSENETIKKDDMSTLDGKKVGANENSFMHSLFEQFMQENGIACELILYDGHFSCMEALAMGEIDAFVTTANYNVDGIKPLVKVGESDTYIGVNKSRPDLLKTINQVQSEMNEVEPYYIEKLQDKYFYRGIVKQKLSREEEARVAGKTLKMGCLNQFLPYSDVLPDGNAEGVVAALANELSDELQISVDCVEYESYEKMKEALKSGEVDMIFPEYADLWEAEQKNITVTDGIVSDRVAFVFKESYEKLTYDKIAVARSASGQAEYLREYFPSAESVYCDTIAECLQAVADGEASCTFSASNVLLRYLGENHEAGVSLHSVLQSAEVSYAIGVRREDVLLYSVLRKVLMDIDMTEISNAMIKSSYTEPEYTFSLFIKHNAVAVNVALTIFAMCLLLAILIVLYKTKQHHEEMMSANAMLKEQLEIIQNQENIMTKDALTKVYNRYQLECYTARIVENYQETEKAGLKLCMAVMDLDKFKSINDGYGHQEGDRALVKAAGIMKEICDENNVFLARYGGDEFIMVGQFKSKDDLLSLCDMVNEKMEHESEKLPYQLNISVGTAEYDSSMENFQAFFKTADTALYRVKEEKKSSKQTKAAKNYVNK